MNTVRFWFPCSTERGMPSMCNPDTAHRDGVDRIVTRDRDDAHAIARDDMLALSKSGDSCLPVPE